VLQWLLAHRSLPPGSDADAPPALRSQFVTVLDAYLGTPVLGPVRRLVAQAVGTPDYAPIALEVTVPGGRDLILANAAETDSLTCGEFALTGRFGLVRERDGKVVDLRLVAGTRLSAGELLVTLPPAASGRIVAVDRSRRTITIEGTLPVPDGLPGTRLLIDNHGERVSSYTIVAARGLGGGRIELALDSSGNLGEGLAAGFEDGVIRNGPEVNMPFAGLVKIGERFDYSDCYYHGGHLENGKPGVDFRVHGVMGFPYQAWGDLHIAGRNHVHLREPVPAQVLKEALGENGRWIIYDYGLCDEVRFGGRSGVLRK
jgi:hypothetical protein